MRDIKTNEELDRALDSYYSNKDVPEGFQTAWRAAIRREESVIMEQKRSKQQGVWLKRLAPVAAALVLVVGAVVTGQQTGYAPKTQTANESTASYTLDETSYETAEFEDYSFASDAGSVNLYASKASARGAETAEETERKIVRTASLTLKTAAFDEAKEKLAALVGQYAGYVEQLSMTGSDARRASYTIRIPSENLDAFLSELESVARVTERTESRQDKTTEYQDTASRLKTQQEKMARLQELIGKAETVADIIELENAIADTQYQLDSYQTSLNTIDRRADNATVTLTLREEKAAQLSQAQELSLGERIRSGFQATLEGAGQFFQNMLVFLVTSAPVWVMLIVLALVVRFIVKKKKEKIK